MGDGVLAYFGYPVTHEDAAERAIRAGLALVDAVAALRSEDPLSVRIGVATGPVVVGDVIGEGAARERSAAGEPPNLAARLQAAAPVNGLLASAATHGLTQVAFEWEALGAHQLKGFDEAVTVWRTLQPAVVESRFAALKSVSDGLSPLLGRDEELRILQKRWQRAVAGEGQLVLVRGEPGVGKSRLVESFAALMAPGQVLRYQCSPHFINTAF